MSRPVDLDAPDRVVLSGLLAQLKLEKQSSLQNTDKIDDKDFRSKVAKALRLELKHIEELQNKMSHFDA